ncbi:putative secretion system X protein GspG-like [Cupriavidus necator H850]|uniref:type II secretion system protein n=1 Tax=Cupriavidus necator TaxID=106590 RepID=UPI00129EEB8D|nr:type II secretion system protein [Cupriavidus necator]KAI3598975.1 putative secretion system X protein GspG-like [Cupriavidus necator H850]
MRQELPHAARGFTLIELMVTLALMALLASVALPLAELTVRRAQENELRRVLRELRKAINDYKDAADAGKIQRKVGDSGYPPSLEALAEGVPDATDPAGERRLYFLRRLPRDPLCGCPDEPAARNWRLRSYQSPPDDPCEGGVVFDVMSRNSGEALDGNHYDQW